jgi:exopolyphosphatase/guanosine-5'-triphosphate,3'-diphosphate pyrophosphatase
VSVVDLGFNSVKLVNYEIKSNNSFKAYEQEGIKVKLGEGLNKTGFLKREAINRTIDALKLFRDVIEFQSIKHVLPIATSAVREAANRMDFLLEAYQETSFRFKVMSEKEEALYSYAGALKTTCFPNALFFDLGGGSLEIVYTENFRIKKLTSLPLGALRLTQSFGKKDGSFTNKNYAKMERHIMKVLPDRKYLDLHPDTTLVGVGGTLRAMARYDQQIRKYALNKIHNYRMDYESVESVTNRFLDMNVEEIAEIEGIGTSRAETITAGSAVIKTLMQKFRLGKIVVSAQGLREGTLSLFLENPKAYYSGSFSQERIQNSVRFSSEPEALPHYTETLVKPLVSMDLMNEREEVILTHAIKQVSEIPSITNLNNLFYMLIDEDSAQLSHREQLILALSIIHMKKAKTADALFARYKSILKPQNKKSMEKVASCITLSSILEGTKSKVKIIKSAKKVGMKILTAKSPFPRMLLDNAFRDFAAAFNLSVDYSISHDSKTSSQVIRVKNK